MFNKFKILTKAYFSVSTALIASLIASSAQASTFTQTSPTSGGTIDSSFSEVGGIVLDIIGNNGTRVTSQLAASSLFTGFAATNPFTIGSQTGFDASVTNVLGGGIQEVAVRFSLFDGDTANNNFDENDNTLLLNGINFGNWSDVEAENTDSSGIATSAGFSGGGFRNGLLDTGWFFVDDTATLNSFFNSLIASEQVVYGLDDVDPQDNFYDFTQGIDSSQINIGQGPTVQPPTSKTPEPASVLGLLAIGAFGTSSALKGKKSS